jgi:hypothetical protein
MAYRPPLSSTDSAGKWLSQISDADRPAAAALLHDMMLLNEEQVAVAIRSLLLIWARTRKGRRKRIALYAEREFAEARALRVESIADSKGRVRERAVGRKGPAAVSPIRGMPRVGSEGMIAFIISQAVEASPRIYMNQPGPDRLRARTNPAGTIAIVTDFVGSGLRVRIMLDKFWAVPTVRSWVSRGWVDFTVVAAAGTRAGIDRVRRHRLAPKVLVEHVAPTVFSGIDRARSIERQKLLETYGPTEGRGAGRLGFGGTAALIAFSYRLPNNTPPLIHKDSPPWKALYTGPAPDDLRPAFGLADPEEQVNNAAAATGIALATDLPIADAKTIIVLGAIRGRWRYGAETALAEMTGLSKPELIVIRDTAARAGLLDTNGRLTDRGQLALAAGTRHERRRPDIPTVEAPYYPQQLRTPRRPSSFRRPLGRPR